MVLWRREGPPDDSARSLVKQAEVLGPGDGLASGGGAELVVARAGRSVFTRRSRSRDKPARLAMVADSWAIERKEASSRSTHPSDAWAALTRTP